MPTRTCRRTGSAYTRLSGNLIACPPNGSLPVSCRIKPAATLPAGSFPLTGRKFLRSSLPPRSSVKTTSRESGGSSLISPNRRILKWLSGRARCGSGNWPNLPRSLSSRLTATSGSPGSTGVRWLLPDIRSRTSRRDSMSFPLSILLTVLVSGKHSNGVSKGKRCTPPVLPHQKRPGRASGYHVYIAHHQGE